MASQGWRSNFPNWGELGDDVAEYWAGKQSVDEVVGEITKRIEAYKNWRDKTGHTEKAKRSLNTYYGASPDGGGTTSRLAPGGDGELVNMSTNHFAGLVTQAMVLTTSERPAFKSIAVGNGYSDKAQAQTADGVLDHYDRNLFLHQMDKAVALRAILMGEGYGALHWNFGVGEEFADPISGDIVKEGDIEVSTHSLFDVAFDHCAEDFEKLSWVCLRRRVSKWDLAEMYPHKREEITDFSGKEKDSYDLKVDSFSFGHESQENDDHVWLWEFRHIPTPGLQSGRLIRFLDATTVVYDSHTSASGEPRPGAYPYGKRLMVRRMQPDEVIGSIAGHTAFFDLLAQQEGIDLVATIMASSVNMGGAANLYVQRGSNLQLNEIGGGFKLIEGDGAEAPKPINFSGVSKEALEFAQMCVAWMRQRTAINDVVMGEPSKGMPAQAMALLHAQALQFHSGMQDSFQRYMEGIRTDLIDMLKAFAKSKRTALVAGAANQWQLSEFSRKDIEGVGRVYVEQIPAAAKTYAGKMSMAKDLLDMGMVQEPQQYIDMVSTGQLRPMYEAQEANLMRIQAEKDLLRKGIGLPPIDPMQSQLQGTEVFVDDGKPHIRPLITDTHWIDIPEYIGIINTPDARTNLDVVKAVTGVVQYKLKLWRQMDPALIVAMKGIPAPPLMDPAMLGPSGATPPPPGSGANGGEKPPEESELGGLNQLMEGQGQKAPKLPEPPANPLQ